VALAVVTSPEITSQAVVSSHLEEKIRGPMNFICNAVEMADLRNRTGYAQWKSSAVSSLAFSSGYLCIGPSLCGWRVSCWAPADVFLPGRWRQTMIEHLPFMRQ
jgi:hypothetical protein